jgi:hypothetical protein
MGLMERFIGNPEVAKDAAKLFIRFTKLYRELSNRIPFQGAFADGRV